MTNNHTKRLVYGALVLSLASIPMVAASSEVADAAMKGNREAVRSLIQRKADVNAQQVDGSTALHWAVQADDLETADLLLHAGAKPAAANKDGATPLLLASVNGNAGMIEKLLAAGADANAPLTQFGDTALMMASRTGRIDAIKVLLDHGANVNAKEKWGDTTALMWAVSERHPEAVKMLIERGADLNAHSKFVPPTTSRTYEGTIPTDAKPDQKAQELSSGSLTPLMFAAREGDLDSARLLVAAGADINARDGDGKDALGLAIFNGNYAFADFLVDHHANVNQADAQGFTPLFWAVDRRNMETAPNFPWMITTDPMFLIKKLLDAGANTNARIDNTPKSRMREGSPRVVYSTVLMRAVFSGDLEVVNLLLAHGADPHVISTDRETLVSVAAGLGFIRGYHKERPMSERLEVLKLMVKLGGDVNYADNYGITPLMAAANIGETSIIQYLIDQGADLSAHDLGKKNDGSFGSSVEPLMAIDYAIGVGTFIPNNAVFINEAALKLITEEMKKRGIPHTTSECTLRGFTCPQAHVDPKTATPAEIARARKVQTGNQVDGITGGLAADDKDKDKAKK
jgi:ankyrin repeat protein